MESIPGAQNTFGLLQAIEHVSIFQSTTTLNFLHLSVQEFLAANYITTLTPDEELFILNEYFWNDSLSNMFTIYINLTKGHRFSFRKFLSGGNDTISIHSKLLHDKLKCIQLYRCFNEASGDDHVCITIERIHFNGIISFPGTTLSTNDVDNISILLSCSSIKQWKRLNLMSCHIHDAGLHIIHQRITSSITIEQLWLSSNDLSSSSDGCLIDIVITCGVKWLSICDNKSIGETKEFFPIILTPSSSLIERLDLTAIRLSSKVAITIFTLLKEKMTKLKVLIMAYNDINDDACDVLAETLQVNSTLWYLNIHGNKISKETIQFMINSLRYNNTVTKLHIPGDYSENDKKQILSLEYVVNEERKHCGCQAKLNCKIWLLVKFSYTVINLYGCSML